MLQAHLSSLNNLELCIKAFFRNDNILKPRNADNDVYEKQHQFNALPNTQNASHAPLVYYQEVSTAC